jgi:hypothetical protein
MVAGGQVSQMIEEQPLCRQFVVVQHWCAVSGTMGSDCVLVLASVVGLSRRTTIPCSLFLSNDLSTYKKTRSRVLLLLDSSSFKVHHEQLCGFFYSRRHSFMALNRWRHSWLGWRAWQQSGRMQRRRWLPRRAIESRGGTRTARSIRGMQRKGSQRRQSHSHTSRTRAHAQLL